MNSTTALLFLGGAASAALLLAILRFLWIYREIQARRNGYDDKETRTAFRSKKCKTLVVLGSGGHTSEMLHMVSQLDSALYDPIVYVVADTDHTSIQRLQANPELHKNDTIVHKIPRSREVGQSFTSSFITTIYALIHAIVLTIQIRPELVLCNGPGTCVPVILGAWLIRMPGFPCQFLFCESFCRVETLSLAGKLLYPIVDCFIVHWQELHQKYPKSPLSSTFVVNHNQQ
ncbi:acetylglucosamine transferase subunit ALG14 homolog [Seminavis robusta]|uniref:UDP-N-acetylglucosamine transferase subunit ALG14 n=1 Tax=Seminavis robusta TaxID=568900 RepID=A0A9N8DY88_9STRA|nr:acetylglucosamine transferase subunit ALG14 homolog [Seminavis robusta]|eukprot:Sro447_g144860.1 acetylglucosamine transferase subunit ALG14 homolog (231) ;mRNA; f:24369-25061